FMIRCNCSGSRLYCCEVVSVTEGDSSFTGLLLFHDA
ncbi:hypothetical protein A2U01_0049558, partial [Trifolium medium]|nr:hypothetical protein [Trifolium medium]